MSRSHRQPSSPSKGRTLRLGSAFAAMLAVAMPLLETVHASSVAHITCAEHGELVHLDEANAHRPSTSPHQHSAGGVLLAEREPLAPGLAGALHDHCAVVLHSRQRSINERQAIEPFIATAAAAAVEHSPERPLGQQERLFRLAPKNSPPTA
jgi:hypothetical protein